MKVRIFLSLLILMTTALYLYSKSQQDQKSNTQKPARQTGEQTGQQLFAKTCLACHQADGNGVRNMFPPLAGNEKVTGPSADVIKIVLFGLQGPVTVNGRDYDQVCPRRTT
jgi:nitrite reductase (NO-forming)